MKWTLKNIGMADRGSSWIPKEGTNLEISHAKDLTTVTQWMAQKLLKVLEADKELFTGAPEKIVEKLRIGMPAREPVEVHRSCLWGCPWNLLEVSVPPTLASARGVRRKESTPEPGREVPPSWCPAAALPELSTHKAYSIMPSSKEKCLQGPALVPRTGP